MLNTEFRSRCSSHGTPRSWIYGRLPVARLLLRDEPMVMVALDAVPNITTRVSFGVPAILAIALQALVVLPAPAFRIVLASFGIGLADVTVF